MNTEPTPNACPACDGDGRALASYAEGYEVEMCSSCGGSGRVQIDGLGSGGQ